VVRIAMTEDSHFLMPQSPGYIFESWPVLQGRFTFREY
jgi:hypothetical protein